MTTEINPERKRVTTDPRRYLGMAWRRLVTLFLSAWLTLVTLGRK